MNSKLKVGMEIEKMVRGYLSTVDADVVTGEMIKTDRVSRGSYIAPFEADKIMALVKQLVSGVDAQELTGPAADRKVKNGKVSYKA